MWFFIITYHIQENISYAFFDLTLHFLFFCQERQWCFCSSVTSCLQWKDTFPFYSGYLHATFFCFPNFSYLHIFCHQPSRNVSRLSPYFSPFFLAMQEHSKPLRESLTYYLCAHEEKELIMPEIRQIAYQHVSFCFHFFLGFCFYVAILHALFFFHHALYDCHF